MLKLEETSRGFDITNFTDQNGNVCSLQKSSIATEDRIWLGVDEIHADHFVDGRGWMPIEFPADAQFNSRMHLNRQQVEQLLPFLQKFVKTGELS